MPKERDLNGLLERNLTFLRRGEVDRPLRGVSDLGPESPLQQYKQMAVHLPSSGPVQPEMIRVKEFLEDVDRLILEHEKVGGDLFWPAAPFIGLPWIEAIVGCPIRVSSGSFWAASPECDWEKLQEVDLSEGNVWLQKLLELQEALVNHLKGRYPVGVSTMMRGPADMAGASLGHAQFVLLLYDHLEKVESLLSCYTESWLKVAELQRELSTSFQGGYTVGSWVGLWAPQPCQYLQDDALALLSPSIYQGILAQYHRDICASTRYSLFHLHPSALYAVEELLKIDNLTVIEVNREMVGPSIEEVLPILKRIHERKALFIHWCAETADRLPIEKEVRCVLQNLSPRGLCLNLHPQDVQEGRAFLSLVDKEVKSILH